MGKFIDLTGSNFGRLTVVEQAESKIISGQRVYMWRCKCTCGNDIVVLGASLRRGGTRSCGCFQSEMKSKRSFIDMTGRKFGRLTVIEIQGFIPRSGHGRGDSMWLCSCNCGNKLIVMGKSLRSGNTQSCGCLRLERLSEAVSKPNGEAGKNAVLNSSKQTAMKKGRIWKLSDEFATELMLQNCFYCGAVPQNKSRDFIYNGLDRIDNSKGYTPENVVPCCIHCNRAKRTRSVDEFLEWVKEVFRHSILEKGKV